MSKREYCCGACGLIWFGGNSPTKITVCPECYNTGKEDHSKAIFACDTNKWLYCSKAVVGFLEARGEKIHYHKDHPWAYRNEEV